MKHKILIPALIFTFSCADRHLNEDTLSQNQDSLNTQVSETINLELKKEIVDSNLFAKSNPLILDSINILINPWPIQPPYNPWPWEPPIIILPWPIDGYYIWSFSIITFETQRDPGSDDRLITHQIFKDNCFQIEREGNKLFVEMEISNEIILDINAIDGLHLTPLKKPNWLLNEMVFKKGDYQYSIVYVPSVSNSVQLNLHSENEVLQHTIRI